MLLSTSVSLLSLLATSISAASVSTSEHTSVNANNKGGFVTVKDGIFKKDGKPYYLTSINYWAALNLAASQEAGGNLTRFKAEVKQMKAAGINNVRIMASSEGSQLGIQPFRMYPALMESPGKYNEAIFVGLDRSLAAFKEAGMTVVMTLNDYWHWSGGFSQYVSWASGSNATIPYPPSWDPTLNPPYGDYTTNGTWGDWDPATNKYTGFVGYAGRFYNDSTIAPTAQKWYKAHIAAVVNRVNTVTGVAYKDDPTIMTWELANEPQDPPVEWVKSTSEYIKKLAPKQLVTAGFEGKNGEWWFKRVHSVKAIDYTTVHVWPQNRGWYDMTDPSRENFQNAIGNASEVIHAASQWTKSLGKPAVLEEFGMARDNWENVAKGAPTKSYIYDASARTTNKDKFYQFMIGYVVDDFRKEAGKAFAGTGPWAYGGQWRPFHKRNQFNEAWAGDPPHEAPGWYDIYDKDASTLAIIKAEARNTTAAIQSWA